jgi:adenosylcobinamide kinase / adenosylcobinamide-phosphate guanylyltransferase
MRQKVGNDAFLGDIFPGAFLGAKSDQPPRLARIAVILEHVSCGVPPHPMTTSRQVLLVTGPARSGKSEWAESLAQQTGRSVVYVATAALDPTDVEWQARIERHRQRRSPEWQTWPVPVELAATLRAAAAADCLLVDSLGTWLANLLEQDDRAWEQTVSDFLDSLVQGASTVILVSEETGWGVVPAYPLGRTFRDRLGSLTRQIAAIADTVYLVTGGYVLDLRQLGQPLATAIQPRPPL